MLTIEKSPVQERIVDKSLENCDNAVFVMSEHFHDILARDSVCSIYTCHLVAKVNVGQGHLSCLY